MKEKKFMGMDHLKINNERIINDKITLLKNNTDILNIRINTLEERYMPLLLQMNDALSKINEIYDEIKKKTDQKKVLTPKNITANKIIMQETLGFTNQIKTESNKKNIIKLNNTMLGINLNYPKAKNIKNDREKSKEKDREKDKEKDKDKELIYDEMQIKEKKMPTDIPNKVLRKVEPFLIKFLKNTK